ncbi:MAG: beta-ureidopropionase [Gammaproteobacteria bacterium]|jgi:beta-ureidopropionase
MRTALIQFAASTDVGENLAKAESLIEQASAQGAQIACLQECFNTWFFAQTIDPDCQALAEPIDGRSVTRMRALAKRLNLHIVVPYYERVMAGELYNSVALVSNEGEVIGSYRKHHLPMSSHFNEKFYFRPGNSGFPVFDTALGRIGIMICYDRHFPEAARALGLAGAEYVFVPTATTTRGFSRSVWEPELRGHAIANGFWVIGVNRVGVELESTYYGASVMVDPIGAIHAQAGDSEEVLVADLPRARVEEVRKMWPFYRDRRPDAYASLVKP